MHAEEMCCPLILPGLLVSTTVYSLVPCALVQPSDASIIECRPVITPPETDMALAATRGRLGLRCASCLGWQRARLPPVAQSRCCSTRPASGLLDVLIIQPKHARRRTSHLRRCDALHCHKRPGGGTALDQ